MENYRMVTLTMHLKGMSLLMFSTKRMGISIVNSQRQLFVSTKLMILTLIEGLRVQVVLMGIFRDPYGNFSFVQYYSQAFSRF